MYYLILFHHEFIFIGFWGHIIHFFSLKGIFGIMVEASRVKWEKVITLPLLKKLKNFLNAMSMEICLGMPTF